MVRAHLFVEAESMREIVMETATLMQVFGEGNVSVKRGDGESFVAELTISFDGSVELANVVRANLSGGEED